MDDPITRSVGPPQGGQAPIPSEQTPPPVAFYIPLAPPTVTRILIGLLILVFVAAFLFGLLVFGTLSGTTDLRVLYLFGMKSNVDILQGQVWRLFTAMFIHIGPVHLISNLIGLFMLGPIIEGHLGHWRFAAIYLIGGLFGSVASYALSPALSAGASGAIFALLGATILYFYRFRENFGQKGKDILRSMLVVLGLNLFLGLSVGNIDNWGHLGGLVGGLLLTAGLLPRYRLPDQVRVGVQPLVRETHLLRDVLWVLFCTGLLMGAFWLATLAGPPLQ